MGSYDNNSLREDGDGRWLFEVGGKNKELLFGNWPRL
jgi:hypothetical protein